MVGGARPVEHAGHGDVGHGEASADGIIMGVKVLLQYAEGAGEDAGDGLGFRLAEDCDAR